MSLESHILAEKKVIPANTQNDIGISSLTLISESSSSTIRSLNILPILIIVLLACSIEGTASSPWRAPIKGNLPRRTVSTVLNVLSKR